MGAGAGAGATAGAATEAGAGACARPQVLRESLAASGVPLAPGIGVLPGGSGAAGAAVRRRGAPLRTPLPSSSSESVARLTTSTAPVAGPAAAAPPAA